MYLHTDVWVHTPTWMQVHACNYTCEWMHSCVHACIFACMTLYCIHLWVHVCTWTYVAGTQVHMCMQEHDSWPVPYYNNRTRHEAWPSRILLAQSASSPGLRSPWGAVRVGGTWEGAGVGIGVGGEVGRGAGIKTGEGTGAGKGAAPWLGAGARAWPTASKPVTSSSRTIQHQYDWRGRIFLSLKSSSLSRSGRWWWPEPGAACMRDTGAGLRGCTAFHGGTGADPPQHSSIPGDTSIRARYLWGTAETPPCPPDLQGAGA